MSTPAQVGRDTADRYRNPITARTSVIAAMCAGLALTVIATVVPYLDRVTFGTLANHIRAGYPTYSRARIDRAVTTYLVYLTVVGVLGVAGWLWSLHALKADKRWFRGCATSLFLLGTTVALTDLLIKDTSGDTGLPPLLGWIGTAPCLPGLLVVTLLWRRPWPHPTGEWT